MAEEKALTKVGSLDGMLQMAQTIHKSGLLPISVKTPEAALVIMLKGRELGLSALQSFSDIYVVNGQPSLSTKLMAALFEARGHRYEKVESTADICVVRLHLRDGRKITHQITRKEAELAHWHENWDYKTKKWKSKHTWKGMPRLMLFYRTLSHAIRMYAPACLFGMLTQDEAVDASDSDILNGWGGETVNGVATVLESKAEGEEWPTDTPEPPEASDADAEPHWSENPEAQRSIELAKKEYGLNDQDVLIALEVETLAEYEGPFLSVLTALRLFALERQKAVKSEEARQGELV